MRRVVVAGFCVVGIAAFAGFMRYGTISPCGALKQRLAAAAFNQAARDGGLDDAASVAGTALGVQMIDGFISSRSPTECLSALYDLEISGENPFSELHQRRVNGEMAPDQARRLKVTHDLRVYENALTMYKLDNGRFPSAEQGLDALMVEPKVEPVPHNWHGYLKALPTDPWGNRYVYRPPEAEDEDPTVMSLGADGERGGKGPKADISTDDLE